MIIGVDKKGSISKEKIGRKKCKKKKLDGLGMRIYGFIARGRELFICQDLLPHL